MRRLEPQLVAGDKKRKGAILALTMFFLAGIMTFIGMSVDLGMINVTKSTMQATADSAALAATQEIVAAVRTAGAEGGDGSDVEDAQAYAENSARQMAKDIAALNGFFVDPAKDVKFGKRKFIAQSQSFEVDWTDSTNPNVVKVIIRKDNPDMTKGDAKLRLMFAPAFGDKTMAMRAEAAAYVEARDIVSVLDYSGSMNYDSVPFKSGLDRTAVRDNLDDMWDELVAADVEFSDDSSTMKFPAGGFGKIDSYAGSYKYSSSAETIFDYLELEEDGGTDGIRVYDYDNYSSYIGKLYPGTHNLSDYYGMNNDINSFKVPDGYTVTFWDYDDEGGWQYGPKTSNVSSMGSYSNDANWAVVTGPGGNSYEPYPQEGRYSDGSFRGKPSKSESKSRWKDYIQWVINHSSGGSSAPLYISSSHDYRYDFGYRTLMTYMIYDQRENTESEDLWRVSAYPFKAVKDGMTQLTDFLGSLQFGDHLALVDYGSTAVKEKKLSASDVSSPNSVTNVDLGSKYMTMNYDAIETMQLHKQAAHYSASTNIGDGVKYAREILETEGRPGARWQMLVMTDGVVNRPSSLPSMPSGWDTFNWNAMTDWDGDGVANYDNSDLTSGSYTNQKKYLFYQAKLAVQQGMTIHTMAVGNGADTNLMRAVATYGGGVFIHIPGGTSAEAMAQTLEEKFSLLAGNVPPAKLLFDE